MRCSNMHALWGVLGSVALAGCMEPVRSGLSEAQANDIVVALDAVSIAATRVVDRTSGGAGRYRVEVPTDDTAHALRVLAATLPAPPQPGFDEVYASPSLVPTLGEERARWTAATAGEVARSLRGMAGVHDARVHVALPDREGLALDPGDSDDALARAAVLITRRPGTPPVNEDAVRLLVSSAIPGLAPGRVAVVQALAEPEPSSAARIVSVGPIRVLAESVPTLRLAFVGALTLDALLALALFLVVVRRKR